MSGAVSQSAFTGRLGFFEISTVKVAVVVADPSGSVTVTSSTDNVLAAWAGTAASASEPTTATAMTASDMRSLLIPVPYGHDTPCKSKRPTIMAGRLGYREERYVFFVCGR